jgi:hypothetical protein
MEGKEGKRRKGKEEGGGEGLRATHPARTPRIAERSELCDSGSEGKEKGGSCGHLVHVCRAQPF